VAYDGILADRVRDVLADEVGVVEKRMFGGVAFLLNGNLACGLYQDSVLVRLPAEEAEVALAEPGVRAFDMVKQRPMRGWVLVGPDACAEDEDLDRWVRRGLAYAGSMPPK
jgi:TfoX/Sxy family transcriptional regulator of competence genes